jgi:hypothetical protein
MSFKSPYELVKTRKKRIIFKMYYKVPMDMKRLTFRIGYEIIDWLRHSVECSWCDENFYVVLPSNKMKKLYGNGYVDALNELVVRGIIECKELEGNGAWKNYDFKRGIARSFRLRKWVRDLFETTECVFEYRLYSYEMPKLKRGPFALKRKTDDPRALKLLEAYKSIDVKPEWIDVFVNGELYPSDHILHPNEPMSQSGIFLHCKYFVESIYGKKIDVKTDSECMRAFHAVLMMSEAVRKYVRVDRKIPVNIDAVSLHPYLIAHYIKDEAQRNRYLRYLKDDIYKLFANEQNSRGNIKVMFQKYLSGSKLYDPKAIEIERWFQENFPDVDKMRVRLKKHKTTFQMQLQQLEASIFVDKVFMGFDKWNLPMHDGLMVKEEDRDEAVALIKNACVEKLGYEIPLSVK